MKNLDFEAITDPGKVRQDNEDTFIAQQLWQEGVALLAAIDGVGGYEGGEVAADDARKTLIEHLEKSANGERPQLIREAIAEANNRIFAKSKTDPILARMSCVLTVAIIDIHKQLVYFGHVGDTRLYHYRNGTLRKLSRDHSLVGYREEQGQLSEEEAMNHSQRNEIMRSLGTETHGANDDGFIDTGIDTFAPNDILLLCSDGLTDMITSQQIIDILQTESNLETKNKALVAAANQAGGKDNITVVLATYSKAVETKTEKPITQNVIVETVQPAEKEEIVEMANPKPTTHRWLLPTLTGLLGFFLGASTCYFILNIPQQKLPTPVTQIPLKDSLKMYQDSLKIRSLKPDSLTKEPNISNE